MSLIVSQYSLSSANLYYYIHAFVLVPARHGWAQFRQTFILLLLTSQTKYALKIFQRQSFSRNFNWHYRQKLSVITLHCIYWANKTFFWNGKDGNFFPMKILLELLYWVIIIYAYHYVYLLMNFIEWYNL